IAISTKPPMFATAVDAHWAAAARETGVLLQEAGHSVRPVDPPYGPRLVLSELARWVAGTELDARLLADRSVLPARTRRHAAAGRVVLRAGLPRANGQQAWRRRAERFFADHDVLITPALAQPPLASVAWARRGWLANLWSNSHYAPFAAPWNLAGWPAMAVPAGRDPNGLPLSVQLVARPGGEALLLGVAAQLEQRRPWPRTAPTSDY
ncbi:MAG: amidase, partial [Pseudonocardiales bacterium]|nr:amidase [Pseudonocardiales bacterium]